MTPVPSPCDNTCIVDRDTCTGCGRTVDEIANWMSLSENERRKIVERVRPSLLVEDD